MTSDESVWITGVGAGTPLGFELDQIEANLLAGRSGVSPVTRFPTDDYPSRIAAQIDHIPQPPGCDPLAFSARPRLEQLAHWCAERALRDAGLWGRHLDARVGLVLGLGAEWMLLWEDDHFAGGVRLFDPEKDRVSTIERVRRGLGLSGPALAISAACQRQPRFRAGPRLASPGARRLLRRRRLRPGRFADRARNLRQPARAFPAERKPVRGFPSVRPRPRRLRPG